MATMVLLGYHLFLTTFMGNKEVDVSLCKKILDEKVSTYPNGVFFLFFKGRFHLVQVNIVEHKKNYRKRFTRIIRSYQFLLISYCIFF